MNWFSVFYGKTQNPLPLARDPFDSLVIKSAVAELGSLFWSKMKRAERITSAIKQAKGQPAVPKVMLSAKKPKMLGRKK